MPRHSCLRAGKCPHPREEKAVDSAFRRAQALEAAGERASARDAYIAILAADPTHLGALTNLGTLLTYSGFKRAGRLAYAQAVEAHPSDLRARTNFAAALLDAGESSAALAQYEAALGIDPHSFDAHQGLAILHARNGTWEEARAHARIGFAGQPVRRAPPLGGTTRTPLLVLLSALGGNVDTERIIDVERFACDVLVAEFYEPSMRIDDYPLIFNAIGDAERCSEALARARGFVATRKERTINDPSAVLESTRARNTERLAKIPGLRVPRTREMMRAEVASAPFTFPILLRSLGFHTGEHFERVESSAALQAALAGLPGDRILAIEFIDTRRADGSFEKYRVLIVGDRMYPIHFARAQQWKVHYFSSQCGDESTERAFLADASGAIGARACETLDRVRAELGLDYGGIDFALDARGDVVLFEANATMNLFDPGPDAAPERRAAFETVRTAVSDLLDSRANDRT